MAKFKSLPLLMFEFKHEGVFGIGTLSCIEKPPLPDLPDEINQTINQWISNETDLMIKWPKKPNSSNWNPTIYESNDSSDDFVFKSVKAVLISNDRDFLREKIRQTKRALKPVDVSEQAITSRNYSSSRPLTKTVSRQLFTNLETSVSHESSETTQIVEHGVDPVSFKRRLEKENEDLMNKIKRMKRDYDEIEKENDQLRMKVNSLENKYDSLCKQNAEMEDENMDLKEKLEKEDRDGCLPVGLLMDQMEDLIKFLKSEREERQASVLNSPASSLTPSSRSSPTVNKAKMVKLDGNVMIEADALKNAISYGRTANSDHNLHAMVNALLDAFWKPSELAEFSLSGRACPSIKGSKPKEKFPQDMLRAITNCVISRWEKWYSVVLSTQSIKNAIGARLTTCHTLNKKKKLKTKDLEDGDEIDAQEETGRDYFDLDNN